MKTPLGLAVVALLTAGAGSANAQVTLEFQNGKVRLNAQNVSVSQILSEWARRGRTTIVNGERIPGPAVTLELQDVSEQQALDVVLRGVSGYLVAARENAAAGTSSFDRIYILPTSTRPANTPPPPQQAFQVQQQQDDINDDEPPLPGPRGVNQPPNTRLPPGVAGRAVPVDDNVPEPENRPAPTPANPFGVQPGTTRPGVINPSAPGIVRPNQ